MSKTDTASGIKLINLATHYKVDGDVMRCRGCSRAQQVSHIYENFAHSSLCKFNLTGDDKPWMDMFTTLNEVANAQA